MKYLIFLLALLLATVAQGQQLVVGSNGTGGPCNLRSNTACYYNIVGAGALDVTPVSAVSCHYLTFELHQVSGSTATVQPENCLFDGTPGGVGCETFSTLLTTGNGETIGGAPAFLGFDVTGSAGTARLHVVCGGD